MEKGKKMKEKQEEWKESVKEKKYRHDKRMRKAKEKVEVRGKKIEKQSFLDFQKSFKKGLYFP